MPITLPPRRPHKGQAGESFLLKSMLVATALLIGALVMVNEEFYFSTPAHSLSEVEAALRLAVR